MSSHVPNAKVGEMFAEMDAMQTTRRPEYRADVPWAELAWGMYVVDRNEKVWQVVGNAMGWVRLLDIHGAEVSVPHQQALPRVVVWPADEQILLLERVLGASRLTDQEPIIRQVATAEAWAVPLMPSVPGKRNTERIKTHIEWFHAKGQSTGISAEDLPQLHEELHASIHDTPMFLPHHHEAIPRERKGR